jgi:hypothetical protein
MKQYRIGYSTYESGEWHTQIIQAEDEYQAEDLLVKDVEEHIDMLEIEEL